ncbi:helix-turn-helix domain-containing protein [Gemmatimonas sp.]|uniref:helix-turn-helix domain-containing protein n=1 Tax=Gemmatimonas sp. TaxID=1962908 RepID=UPI003982EF56
MYDIRSLHRLVHDARLNAHLSQRDFADRVGTSQSAIAKLEQGDANPTIDTLARCAEAAGLALQFTLVPLPVADAVVERYKRDVDRTLLRENLRRSTHERLRSLGEWQGDLKAIQYAVKHARPKKVAEAPPKPAARNRRRP